VVITDADEASSYRAQSLTRGLTVLRSIAEARQPLTLQDLYDRTAIPKPTLVRLLAILTHENCTVRLDDRPTYALGLTVRMLAAGLSDDLDAEELAQPYLEQVSAALGHTANLGVLSGGQVLHLCVVLTDRPIRYTARSGTRDDAHATGLGKALLAQLTAKDVSRRLSHRTLVPKTPHTITTHAELARELRRIRSQGFAYDAEEGAVGLCCFAVPVLVNGLPSAALSVSGPAGELPPASSRDVIPVLKEFAAQMAGDVRLTKALAAFTTDN
jgi:IclR family acetate operon transcriptional repressor